MVPKKFINKELQFIVYFLISESSHLIYSKFEHNKNIYRAVKKNPQNVKYPTQHTINALVCDTRNKY